MCGIIGYIGFEDAVPIITDGLKRLEYRGYDSAGIAVLGGDKFAVVKREGRMEKLESQLAKTPISGNLGIGHTRWASHGPPSDENSHPHIAGRIALVHNGIIENYLSIKEKLAGRGIVYSSQTDSEVVAHLIDAYYDGDLVDAVIRAAGEIAGSFALGVMCADEPDILVAIKKDNPLIVGVSDAGNFIASDVPAILARTRSVHYLNDMEIAVIREKSVEFFDIDKNPIDKTPEIIDWDMEAAEMGGYPHFMMKEIMEQPAVLRHTFAAAKDGRVIDSLDIARFNRIIITACGSAYNAGMVAKYAIERLCRICVEVELASEFRYKDPIVDENSLVIVISQSGETADTIAAMREAKRLGATTFAIVNVVGSTIAKEADHAIFTAAGPEIAVATTKAFSAQLMLLYIMAVRFALQLNRITTQQSDELINEIAALPEKVDQILTNPEFIKKYADAQINRNSIFFIGRNIDYAIAMEGSLKLKEISYIHSEAYAGGELKHGTISLMEENTLVIAISCSERLETKIMNNVEQVISRGAFALIIGNASGSIDSQKIRRVALPACHELFAPSLSVIIMQLFSYYVAAAKGLDIDKPRNLAKSVTIE